MHFSGPLRPGNEWMSPANNFSTFASRAGDQHWHFIPSSSGAARLARSSSRRAVEWTLSLVIFW